MLFLKPLLCNRITEQCREVLLHVALETNSCGKHVALFSHVANAAACGALNTLEEGAAIAVGPSKTVGAPGSAMVTGVAWFAGAAVVETTTIRWVTIAKFANNLALTTPTGQRVIATPTVGIPALTGPRITGTTMGAVIVHSVCMGTVCNGKPLNECNVASETVSVTVGETTKACLGVLMDAVGQAV